ncbi:MAG: hypothetical protein JSW65_00195 [Candidatus Bipolaricaulota bacterium]|nr:MAG: hypothetical protein JSW65_00195 [Candidatus Bipolaricaulota bacterium]
MTLRDRARIVAPVLVPLLILGCVRRAPVDGTIILSVAPVDRIEIRILESFPVQVHVVVRGSLPDACTAVREVAATRSRHRFVVEVTAQRDRDALCAQVLTPYEEVVPLDVLGLPAGTYVVEVHGLSATFRLETDNIPVDAAARNEGSEGDARAR